MWLVPYEKFKIKTYLTPNEVRQKLNETVKTTFGPSDKPFYGIVGKNYFKIKRIIYYKTLLPSIEGVIQSDDTGSIINVKIQADLKMVGLFMLMLLIILVGLDISPILANFLTNQKLAEVSSLFKQTLWAGIQILLLSYGVVLLAYHFEAAKAKSLLRKLFG